MTINEVARTCHEVNRVFCASIGDNSQKSWYEAEEWQRDSMLKGVAFRLANPTAPESAMHDAWMDNKKAEGWIWGEVKDAEKKTHPAMVSYDKLPAEQKTKDKFFVAIIDSLLGGLLLSAGASEVDVNFNPSALESVQAIKMACAHAWNTIEQYTKTHIDQIKATETGDNPTGATTSKIGRLSSMAKSSIEMASMQAVKAVTRK